MQIEKEIKAIKRHMWVNSALILLWFVFLQICILYLIRFAEDVVEMNERVLELKHKVESLDNSGS